MPTNKENIDQLQKKLEALLQKHYDFSREIGSLQVELEKLQAAEAKQPTEAAETKETIPLSETSAEIKKEPPPAVQPPPLPIERPTIPALKLPRPPQPKSDAEKFIGENLFSKIGIIILVLGVSIGTKYAIDHQLISPLTRIILGYLLGIGLLSFAIRLRKNYENFSAVLLSGAMAILYFITYAAYSFYDLMPQLLAFGLMVLFTVFTVVAALSYDRQIIAHMGLVGAYAVPYLLSDDSGNVKVLFTYTTIINLGILVIALRKNWKPIYYSAFALSWLIYFSWYVSSYQTAEHFGLSLSFLFIFFVTFYLTFLSYKLLEQERFQYDDILVLLANSFIFYGIGYNILDYHEIGMHLLGLFTLGNAILHSIVAYVIFRQKLADRNLFFFVSGLVLVFITIAFPVQLDGNWVTLLWVGEAALLFWIGRTKNVPVYEKLSYPLMFLAFFSLLHDWGTVYGGYQPELPETRITPLLNINFLSALLFVAAFAFMHILNNNKKYSTELPTPETPPKFISFCIPAILLFVLYYTFNLEINCYWNQRFTDSRVILNKGSEGFNANYWDYDLELFKIIWTINYTLLFFSALAFLNFRKLKHQLFGYINLILLLLALLFYLTLGLYAISDLRESYLSQEQAEYYQRGAMHLAIRYISFVFVAAALLALWNYTRQEFIKPSFKMAFHFVLHTSVLWIASSELIHWMDMADFQQSYKLGLSILWGSYALFLVILGIWKRYQALRVGAIGLFGVTLIKLFLYDLSELDTIAKTIVFVSLGILLLIISFLYNKFKHSIFDEPET